MPTDEEYLAMGINPEVAKALTDSVKPFEATGIFMGVPIVNTTDNDGSKSLYSDDNTPNNIVKED